jgi:curli biogenesis system outer membrane secretion channel CsgG
MSLSTSLVRLAISLLMVPLIAGQVVCAQEKPRIVLSQFDSRGLNQWWGGSNFDPGAALTDLLEARLVNSHEFIVVDRSQLSKIMREQSLASAGDVTPTSSAKMGRMIGAGYIIVGRIVQFDRVGKKSSGFGGLPVPSLLGGAGGSSTKTVLHVTAKVIDVNSGQILQNLDAEESASSSSFSLVGFGAGGAGAYSSEDFQSSAMGKLIGSVADDLSKQVTPGTWASAPRTLLTGRIISLDGDSIILNIGSEKGVSVGTLFTVIEQKVVFDPDSNANLTTELERGTIQIISVAKDSSVAKRVDGSIKALEMVRSQ